MNEPFSPQVSTIQGAVSASVTTHYDAREIVRMIREPNGTVEEIRKRARAGEDYGELKKSLLAIMWSGTFSERTKPVKDYLVQYSGLLVADLDDLSLEEIAKARAALEYDPHVWCLFVSPSGAGLKVVFRVKPDADLHKRSFRAAANLIKDLCGLKVDESGKDLARLCFVSQDEGAYLNEGAVELEPAEEMKGEKLRVPTELVSITDLSKRRTVVEALLSGVRWESETVGFCDCPGIRLHTQGDGPKDAKVTLDGAPTLFCFHNSCQVEVEVINKEMRSRIAKLELVPSGVKDEKAALTVMELAALDPVAYEKVRREEAKKVGVRPSVLDDLVKAQRRRSKSNAIDFARSQKETNSVGWEDAKDLVLYESGARIWWVYDAKQKRYVDVNENGARRVLQNAGFSAEADEGEMSPLSLELMRGQLEDHVSYVGAIAGYPAGPHMADGGRVLVPYSNPPPAGRDISCARLKGFLEGLFHGEQFGRFIAWLKFRRQAVKENRWLPGQAVALIGPAQCGKSYTQHLITLLLGGRVAKPWRYLSGGTEFNGDLIGIPHLAVEDDAPKADLATRRLVGAQIKSMLYSRMQSAHSKGRQAVHLDPKWTLTFSLNEEDLMILPPIDDSLMDKITIFKCFHTPRPVPPEMSEQEWLTKVTREEIDGLAHLVDTMEVPDAWFDPRSGVQAYRHPEIEEALSDLAPESQLLDIADEVLFDGPSVTQWQGKTNELCTVLRNSSRSNDYHRIDSHRNAIQNYLRRLANRTRPRVIQNRTKSLRSWIIYRENHQPAENTHDEAEISGGVPF